MLLLTAVPNRLLPLSVVIAPLISGIAVLAVLPAKMLFCRLNVPALSIPPPDPAAVLPEMVELLTISVPPEAFSIPPPPNAEPAVLPEMVELLTVSVPPEAFPIPPPPDP